MSWTSELDSMSEKPTSPTDPVRRNRRTMVTLFGVVAGMIGLSFASVPLYDLFCRVTGYGGTTQVASAFPAQVLDRAMRVSFDAQAHKDLPWAFTPDVREVEVKIGQSGLVTFSATNTSDHAIVGTAVYNVTPAKLGKYFHKVQCFCFEEQVIEPGKTVQFPVYFFVDPALAEDRSMDDVTAVTLSYTFFKAPNQEPAKAAPGVVGSAAGNARETVAMVSRTERSD
jgi:cytochrome c oxidase assembly protein subunit 11